VLAIGGLLLARFFGWLWMDPLAGVIGALVIANWSFVLIRDTGSVLMDVRPDDAVASKVAVPSRRPATNWSIFISGGWTGHLGAVLSVVSSEPGRGPIFYHQLLQRFKGLSHVTVEVNHLS